MQTAKQSDQNSHKTKPTPNELRKKTMMNIQNNFFSLVPLYGICLSLIGVNFEALHISIQIKSGIFAQMQISANQSAFLNWLKLREYYTPN